MRTERSHKTWHVSRQTLRVLSFLILLCCVNVTAAGQLAGFGIKIGMNRASLGGEAEANTPRRGLYGGIYAPVKMNSRLQIQPEVTFSQQGTTVSDTTKIRYSYVQIPVVAKLLVIGGLSLEAGGLVGRLQSGTIRGAIDTVSIRDQLQGFDAALVGGLGYYSDGQSIALGLRYTYGLTNTIKSTPDGLRFTNRVIQVSIGYVIR